MAEAYIVDAVRTPVGRKKGSLATLHSADLGAHAIKALIQRTGVDPAAVDDVVFGCTETIGSQAGDIARTCWLVAGQPNRQCISPRKAS
jgi:acetyl-CoA C-acetyltransferase